MSHRGPEGAAFPHAQYRLQSDWIRPPGRPGRRLRSCTAVRPISSMGERTEDSGMGSSAASEVSLKPTTATSRPTLRPWDRNGSHGADGREVIDGEQCSRVGVAVSQDSLGRFPSSGGIESGPHNGVRRESSRPAHASGPRNRPSGRRPCWHRARRRSRRRPGAPCSTGGRPQARRQGRRRRWRTGSPGRGGS